MALERTPQQQLDALSEMLAGLKKIQAGTMPLPAFGSPPAQGAAARRLLDLLRQFAGFRGNDHLQRKLAKVFDGMGPDELERWVQALSADGAQNELLALVEDLTNHETYFFRDPPQLDIISQHLLPRLVREKIGSGNTTLRIWSAACSTGEEAWTLALLALQALLDAGIAQEPRPGEVVLPRGWRLEVLGTDISRQAIRVARGGSYRTEAMASFRQFPAEFMRFFEAAPSTPGGARQGGSPRYLNIKAAVRRHVRFDLFNLMNPAAPCRDIDLAICRNVLIYLDPATHAGIQHMLRDALRPGGFMMLGVVDRLHPRQDFTDHWFSRSVIHERK